MGKYVNHYTDLSNEITTRQRNTQKAKGNPNKNVHHKKNGSNYRGTPTAQVLLEKAKKQEHVKLPKWLGITLAILFTGVVVTLLLRLTAMKDSMTLAYLSSLLLGLTCGALFYTRLFFRKQKKGSFYSIISLLLAIACLFYTIGGFIGLTGILK